MLNIVIPMAGRGNRFISAGYSMPKPLIPIHGIPMVKVVIDNIKPQISHRFILICLREDLEKFKLRPKLKSYSKNLDIIELEDVTQGQACSALAAKEIINCDFPLMIANADQFINFDINLYLKEMANQKLDGLIMTMKSQDPKWSFVRTNEKGMALETQEKKVISSDATVGIYNFAKGNDFVRSAEKLIDQNFRVNNEFYICPSYNFLIQEGKKIGVFSIGEVNKGMFGLGTPEDLEFFIKNPISQKLIKKNEYISA